MEDLLTKINKLTNEFKEDAAKAVAGNKAAGTRSRKASLEIEKLLKLWRKNSVKI